MLIGNSQQLKVFDLQIKKWLFVGIQQKDSMDKFELLIGILLKIMNEKIQICEVMFGYNVTGSAWIDICQQLDIFFQQGFQLFQLLLWQLW